MGDNRRKPLNKTFIPDLMNLLPSVSNSAFVCYSSQITFLQQRFIEILSKNLLSAGPNVSGLSWKYRAISACTFIWLNITPSIWKIKGHFLKTLSPTNNEF
jgi:hypothetical protein